MSLPNSKPHWNCATWTFIERYRELKYMVKRSMDQKLRLRNFDARPGRIESGVVVKSRALQFPARRAKSTPKTAPKDVEVRRGKGTSEAGVRLGSRIDSRAETSLNFFALNYVVTMDILPNASFISQDGIVNSAINARFRTKRLRNKSLGTN